MLFTQGVNKTKKMENFDKKEYDVTIKHPFSMLLMGMRGSGKTNFIKDLLLSDYLINLPDKIYFVCDSFQDNHFNPLKKYYKDRISFVEDLPSYEEMENSLIIIDDQMNTALTNESVLKAYFKGRHKSISILVSIQAIFSNQGKNNLKTISINSDILVLFPSLKVSDSVKILSRQIYQDLWKFMYYSYEDTRKSQPYPHLLIDNRPQISEKIRLRANIFTNLPNIQVYSPKNST